MKQEDRQKSTLAAGRIRGLGLWRPFLLAFGWLCVALGLAGAVLPVLPTTPFLLLALWAFARSSRRFHGWILSHRLLGPYVRDWERYRVIPPRAKLLALAMMATSLVYVALATTVPWPLVAAMAAVLAAVAVFIVSRPSVPPAAESHKRGD